MGKQTKKARSKRNLGNPSGGKKNIEVLRHHTKANSAEHTKGKKMETAEAAVLQQNNELTSFEITVMQRVAYGAKNNQLASDYNTTTDAIEWHRRQAIRKLAAAHFTHAVAIGFRKKIIS